MGHFPGQMGHFPGILKIQMGHFPGSIHMLILCVLGHFPTILGLKINVAHVIMWAYNIHQPIKEVVCKTNSLEPVRWNTKTW